ncbi:hypothetical protein BGZ52_004630, partial [Haplosporangium bisporale]
MHGEGVLCRIEHFANGRDYFARTGILAYMPEESPRDRYEELPRNRYDGCVYIDLNGTGHLLNMHYLGSTFVNGSEAMRSFMAKYLYGGNGKALGAVIPSSYIVVLKKGNDVKSFKPIFDGIREQLKERSDRIKIHNEYTFIPSFHATLSPAMYDKIKSAPQVAYIEQDQEVKLCTTQDNPTWSLARISERQLDLKQPYHPDANFVPDTSPKDDNGHGTHISAIIGGTRYGVAKKVTIVGVKVFGTSTARGSAARTIA